MVRPDQYLSLKLQKKADRFWGKEYNCVIPLGLVPSRQWIQINTWYICYPGPPSPTVLSYQGLISHLVYIVWLFTPEDHNATSSIYAVKIWNWPYMQMIDCWSKLASDMEEINRISSWHSPQRSSCSRTRLIYSANVSCSVIATTDTIFLTIQILPNK
jgi:hypothetical protein